MVVPSHARAGAPSSNSLLTGRPRFTGVDQESAVVSRVDTPISLAPIPLGTIPPGRLEARNIFNPSPRMAVRGSFDGLLSSAARAAGPKEPSGPKALT